MKKRRREALVISPHFDDAALGACGLMKHAAGTGAQMTVVTINTISDWAPGIQIQGKENISSVRAEEDSKALGFLYAKINVINMGMLDAPLRGIKNVTVKNALRPIEKEYIDKIGSVIKKHKSSLIIAPLGIKHIDHIVANEAVIKNIRSGQIHLYNILFYEELPVCGMVDLEEINRRIGYIQRSCGIKLWPTYLGYPGLKMLKERMMKFYPSQIRKQDRAAVIRHLKRTEHKERIWAV